MLYVKLILKNIFAHKLRNFVITLIISLITMLLFLMLAFSDGEMENFKNGLMALQSPTPDVSAMSNVFYLMVKGQRPWNLGKESSIQNYSELRRKLTALDYVKSVYMDTAMIFADLFYKGNRFNNSAFKGMEIGNAGHILERIHLVEGRLPEEGDEYVLLMNIASTDAFRIKPGDTVTLIGKDFFGQAVAQDLKFIGYYKPNINNPNLNRLAFIDYAAHLMLSGLYKDEGYVLNIDLKENASVKRSIRNLNQWAIDNSVDLKFADPIELRPENYGEYDTARIILLIICFIVILIITIGIVNVVSVNLHDRKKEIGTYYCIGAGRKLLLVMYSMEILIVNLTAAVFGIVLGSVVRYIINSLKITTDDPGIQLVFGGDIFRLGFSSSTVLWIVSGILVITLLTALFSLGSSLKVSPTVAIREVE